MRRSWTISWHGSMSGSLFHSQRTGPRWRSANEGLGSPQQVLPFMVDGIAAQRGQLIHPRSHSQNSNPGSPALASRLCCLTVVTHCFPGPFSQLCSDSREVSADFSALPPPLASLVKMALTASLGMDPLLPSLLKVML